jgi:large subunit ribosomal protein L10
MAGGSGLKPGVLSGYVLSETAGAAAGFRHRLNRGSPVPVPGKGASASIDGEDEIPGLEVRLDLRIRLEPLIRCVPLGVLGDRKWGCVPATGHAACRNPSGFPAHGESSVDRTEKKEAVASLNEVFKKTSVVVVAHYSGLTVAQMQNLRRQMRQAGASVQVAKNRLAKIALEGTDVASIGSLMKGPTLIAYSDDPVAAPKAAVAFAKDNDKLVILGGAMGATALNTEGVKSLATLPSLDELRAKLVGLIQAPATKIAQLTTAPAAKLARVFGAYANRDAA